MKSAIIGSGLIAGIHAQALTSLGIRIGTVINPHIEHAQSFAQQWNIEKASADLKDAFAPEIDAVHICTPPAMHAEIIKALLAHQKQIICEKPLCLDPSDAAEVVSLAQKMDCVNAVVFNCRYYDAVQKMKEYVESGALGRIVLIHGMYQQEYHALPDFCSWRYQPEKAGKMRAVTEIGSHWIDLASYVSGLSIEEVSASFAKVQPQRTVVGGMMHALQSDREIALLVSSEDAAAVTFHFSNGALGSVLLSEVSHGRGNQLTLEIIGTKQSIWWNSEEPGEYYVGEKGKGIENRINAFQGAYPETFRLLFQDVYADIAVGHPSQSLKYPSFADGAYNTAVCSSIYESAMQDSIWRKVKGGETVYGKQ